MPGELPLLLGTWWLLVRRHGRQLLAAGVDVAYAAIDALSAPRVRLLGLPWSVPLRPPGAEPIGDRARSWVADAPDRLALVWRSRRIPSSLRSLVDLPASAPSVAGVAAATALALALVASVGVGLRHDAAPVALQRGGVALPDVPTARGGQAAAVEGTATGAAPGPVAPPALLSSVEDAATTSADAAPAEPSPPPGALPLGKGMWLWQPDRIEGGNVDAMVARAKAVGLTHVYARTGSSHSGFHGAAHLDELLPKAHAAGLRVYGWDFPYLKDVDADVARAVTAIRHTAPGGHRIDGFAADIETRSEGTHLSAEAGRAYGQRLRAAVGDAYPLVVAVPRPSPLMLKRYPYTEVVESFDAIAPMTYWLNRQPDSDVINDVTYLYGTFGKPVIPIGQAYDGAPEGGRPGPPPPDEIQRFLAAAEGAGAVGASFWSWQHANQPIWDTIAAAPEFEWPAALPTELRPGQVRALQAQLTQLGFPVATTGSWGEGTTQALLAYQRASRLTATGVLDQATRDLLLQPIAPPLG